MDESETGSANSWSGGAGVLRELAEYPNSFGPLSPTEERIKTGRFTLCVGEGRRWNTVQRQHFRADEAVARATPALMTQAGAMSRPVLDRLGFVPVGHVHMLLDEFGA
jgi:hypothetical protein